jgi:hypothetical protein
MNGGAANIREAADKLESILSHPAESSGGDAVDGELQEARRLVESFKGSYDMAVERLMVAQSFIPDDRRKEFNAAWDLKKARIKDAAIASGAEHGR